MSDKQNENHVDTQRKLMDKVSEQNDELDSLKAELNLLNQEKESLAKALDSSRAEKFAVDKNRAEIGNMVNRDDVTLSRFWANDTAKSLASIKFLNNFSARSCKQRLRKNVKK